MEVDYNTLLEKAKEFTRKGISWHHHYLPPECILIDVDKHIIILECENQKWQTNFEEKPMEQLEQLENIFFKRQK
ncbi:MAG: hypothetical protein PHQ59_01665 [Candidatus Daviesbacteria bacterium]|nr:hypothetical protein [Candidatus Daviesbacteria bacterium]